MASRSSGFDLLSPVYDFLQKLVFGKSLVRAQNHFLSSVRKSGAVLIVGGGTGKILVEMLRLETGQNYHYVDISRRMLRATKRRVRRYFSAEKRYGERPSIRYICGDISRMPLARYDLIVTPFVLDCFGDQELSVLMPRLAESLTPDGAWLFTDFHIPQGFLHYPARLLIRCLYFCFNRVCELERVSLPDFSQFFGKALLQKRLEYFYLHGILTTCVYAKPAQE